MSSRDPDRNYDDPREGIPFAIEQTIKELVHTALPGRVVSYDPETRRAQIEPALKVDFTDDAPSERRPVIVDVPVCWHNAGGYIVHLPLAPDDPVWIVFSKYGLSAWKKTFEVSDPDRGSFFEREDAVAFPGFGSLEIEPVVTDGLSIQTEDGETCIVIKDGIVHLGTIEGEELVTRTQLERYFNTHIHTTPTGPSGPPIHPTPVTEGDDITRKTRAE